MVGAPTLLVHAGLGDAPGDASLQLYSPPGANVPAGRGVDDRLEAAARLAIDRQAQRDLADWRARWDGALTADGACLPWIHEVDLLVDVFHRERHALTGFAQALADERPATVEVSGADPPLARALADIAAAHGVDVRSTDPGPGPRYPIGVAAAVGPSGRLGGLREAVGAPALLRGDVLLQAPDRHLGGVREELRRRGHRPIDDLLRLPPLPPLDLIGKLAREGSLAHPGWRARRRAAAAHARLLGDLPPKSADADPIAALQHLRARAVLEQRASATLAEVQAARASLRRGRLRALVTGSGAQSAARVLAVAARGADVPLIEALHGFSLGLWSLDGAPAPICDGLTGDRVAAWSERDAGFLAPHAYGDIVHTGNPAAMPMLEAIAATRAGANATKSALVLIQAPGWATAVLGARAPLEHASAALAGLRTARPDLQVVLRPHPLDSTAFDAMVTPSVRLARGGPIEPLLGTASLVVGSLSTATLQAAAAGIPTVMLDPSAAPVQWPFDGSSALPVAHDPQSLATALDGLGERADPAAVADARAALGADPEAVEKTVDLILG